MGFPEGKLMKKNERGEKPKSKDYKDDSREKL